ncbi:MAG: magnesium transporter, partial [Lentisphaerae bacterium]
IFDLCGDQKRLALLLNLEARKMTADLQAALSLCEEHEIAAFVERLKNERRIEILRNIDRQKIVGVLFQLRSKIPQDDFKKLLAELEPADIADLITTFDRNERILFFDLLSDEMVADVLVELKSSVLREILQDLPLRKLSRAIKYMAADDLVEILGDLGEAEQNTILATLHPDQREEVLALMQYSEDSAGLIMTPETYSMPSNATVADTRRALTQLKDFDDPVIYVFVTDPDSGQYLGAVPIAKLFIAPPTKRLEELCETDLLTASPDEDQEEIARRFRKYDILVMPVVDENGKLVGRITSDDILDVMREEADEDLAHFVGAPDIEAEEESPLIISRKRLPWLIVTMVTGLINSVIIKSMMDVTTIDAIAIFVPAILAMGGNTGMQTNAVCVRGIALGQVKVSNLLSIVWREIRVGAMLGMICGATAGLISWSVIHVTGAQTGAIPPAYLALIVGVAMFAAMTFASAYGGLVPIILHRLGADPAIAAGPFVTTSNDLSAAILYFITCVSMLHLLHIS